MLYFRSLVADKSDKTLFYLDVLGDGIRKTNGAITKQRVPIVTVATLGPRYWLIVKPTTGPIINPSESAISDNANAIEYLPNLYLSTKSANNAVETDPLNANDTPSIAILIFKNQMLLEIDPQSAKQNPDNAHSNKLNANNVGRGIRSLKYPAIGVPIKYVNVAIVIINERFNVFIPKSRCNINCDNGLIVPRTALMQNIAPATTNT